MDNKVFNVNGKGSELLGKVLELAFMQEWGAKSPATCTAWVEDKTKGLVLLSFICGSEPANKLPSKMTAAQILPMVEAWLASDFAKEVECTGWDADYQHDGSNSLGWRVYVEDWGHINTGKVNSVKCSKCHQEQKERLGGHSYHSAIVAIKPAYMWHGK